MEVQIDWQQVKGGWMYLIYRGRNQLPGCSYIYNFKHNGPKWLRQSFC